MDLGAALWTTAPLPDRLDPPRLPYPVLPRLPDKAVPEAVTLPRAQREAQLRVGRAITKALHAAVGHDGPLSNMVLRPPGS